jgi:hypothetical protein
LELIQLLSEQVERHPQQVIAQVGRKMVAIVLSELLSQLEEVVELVQELLKLTL